MPALNQNDERYVGTDWLFTVPVTNPDGSVKDLTGASAEWVMQPNINTATPTIKVPSATITDPTGGVLQVSVDKSLTDIAPGVYAHWVIVTDALGHREPVTIGTITVLGLPS